MCTQNSGMIGRLPFMYLNSATSTRIASITMQNMLKEVIWIHMARRTLWGDDHYVDPFFLFTVRTRRKKFDYGSIPGDLVVLGFTADPSGNFLHRVAEHIFPPELAISGL